MFTVLVVDDEPELRRLADRVLTAKTKWRVVHASDGHEAIYKSIEYEPDVILLDVMMPSIDGYGVLRHLKADHICARIPVILVTAAVAPDDLARQRDLGVAGVIAKPFSPTTLPDRVREILGLPEPTDDGAG